MRRQIRRLLNSRQGSFAVDVLTKTGIYAFLMLAGFAVIVYFIQFYKAGYACRRVVREIETSGEYNESSILTLARRLTDGLEELELDVDADYLSGTRHIQLRDEFTVGLHANYPVTLAELGGEAVQLRVPIVVSMAGMSEVFWKTAGQGGGYTPPPSVLPEEPEKPALSFLDSYGGLADGTKAIVLKADPPANGAWTLSGYGDMYRYNGPSAIYGNGTVGFLAVVDESETEETLAGKLSVTAGGTNKVLANSNSGVLKGDIDENGTVETADAMIVLHIAALPNSAWGNYRRLSADIDADGAVTQADGERILNYVARKIPAL